MMLLYQRFHVCLLYVQKNRFDITFMYIFCPPPASSSLLWLSQSKQNLGALVPAFAIRDSLCSFK